MKKSAHAGYRYGIPPRYAVPLFSMVFLIVLIRYGFTESMEMRVSRLEKLAASSSSISEKKDAYVQMAKLLYLAGDMERAAAAWRNAAMTDKNNRDDAALIEAAACFIAIGEYDKASAYIRMALIAEKAPASMPKARYLAAVLEAFRSLDIAPLVALLPDPVYGTYKPSIYYIAWKISNAADYRAKLFSEYPNSPETLAIKDGKAVSAFPSIFWQFLPSAVEEPSDPPQAAMLQAGIFSKEENAQAFVKKLLAAGFTSESGKKTVNAQTYWVVLVPGGENVTMTLARLKAAGFDAFPVK